jgi:hypothetical protein
MEAQQDFPIPDAVAPREVATVVWRDDPLLFPAGRKRWINRTPGGWPVRVIFMDGTETIFVVPWGFESDLASVPKLPLIYLFFGGRAPKASLFHDYLYRTHQDREFADACFYAVMRVEEPKWARVLMWMGVRGFGGFVHNPEQS